MLAGWLVSAWQISLGFTLGLQYSYLLGLLVLLVLWHWWRRRSTAGVPAKAGATAPPDPPVHGAEGADGGGVGPIPRRLLAVTCIGIAILGVVAVYQARPYLQVSHDYPTAKRTIKQVKTYSAGPAALLAASSENRVWGGLTSGMREEKSPLQERERLLSRRPDPRARSDRPGGAVVHATITPRLGRWGS